MHEEFETYLQHLRKLPFAQQVHLCAEPTLDQPDAALEIRTPHGPFEFQVELKRTHLTYGMVEATLAFMQRRPDKRWMLFAPHIAPTMARFLAERGTCFVDQVGNCRVALGDNYLALIEGRRHDRKMFGGQGMRAPGHQVLFAILADPRLLNAPVRILADAAGVGKTAAANTLGKLARDGLIGKGVTRKHALRKREILDRWIAGYAAAVRPRLMVGRYRTADRNIDELEQKIEHVLGDRYTWAWGGGAAAMRLTRHFRGEDTVLHIENAPRDLPERLRAIPADDGPLTVLGAPGKVAYEGVAPKTVHPLLVYTELVTFPNQRARETAEVIRAEFLGDLV